jgi:hypothetical protein
MEDDDKDETANAKHLSRRSDRDEVESEEIIVLAEEGPRSPRHAKDENVTIGSGMSNLQ